MTIIEIKKLKNGSHRNATGEFTTIPDGWAVIPNDIECKNFPFGEVKAEEIDGVMTITEWGAGELPEPDPIPEPEPTAEDMLSALVGGMSYE